MPGGSRAEAKEVVAADLAVGKTVADTATAHGVSPSTIYRWLKEDVDFRERVSELRGAAVAAAIGVAAPDDWIGKVYTPRLKPTSTPATVPVRPQYARHCWADHQADDGLSEVGKDGWRLVVVHDGPSRYLDGPSGCMSYKCRWYIFIKEVPL